jgi:exosome complex component RRP46
MRRDIKCDRGSLHRADGSATWTHDTSGVGCTKVMAAVYGPRQAQARNEDAEKAVVEVVFKPRSGLQGARLAPACMRACMRGKVHGLQAAGS